MTPAPLPTPMPVPTPDGDVLRQACRDLGLADGVADALLTRLLAAAPAAEPATRRELEMMRLMDTPSPDRLVHDLRNLLNELTLLKAAADL